MRSVLVSSTLLLSLAASVVACGSSSSSSGTTSPGAGTGSDIPGTGTPTPGTSPTPGGSGYGEANPGAGGSLQPSTPRLLAIGAELLGLTDDDYALYRDTATDDLAVIPLGQGALPTVLMQRGARTARYAVRGKTIFVWNNNQNFAELRVWSAATGLVPVASSAHTRTAAASDDGSTIVYARLAFGQSAELVRAPLASPLSATPIVQNVTIPLANGEDRACQPRAEFIGARVISSTCSSRAARPTIMLTEPNVPSRLLMQGASRFWSIDASGSRALLLSYYAGGAGGTAVLAPLTQGEPITLERGVIDGFLSEDGSQAVYFTSANALRRVLTQANPPRPETLVAAGSFRTFLGISDDQRSALTLSQSEYPTNGAPARSDVLLVSLTSAGTPRPLVSTTTGAAGRGGLLVMGDSFTKDSRHALYFSDVDTLSARDLNGNGVVRGRLHAFDVGSGVDRVVADNARYVLSANGAVVAALEEDRTAPVPVASSTTFPVNLKVTDLRTGAAPVVVAKNVATLVSTRRGDRIVFQAAAPTTTAAGLYVTDLFASSL